MNIEGKGGIGGKGGVYGASDFELNSEKKNWLHFYRKRERLRGTKQISTFLDTPVGSPSYHT